MTRSAMNDLALCDQEPIHIPGSVQPHGALLAIDPVDLTIARAGGDAQGLLGTAASDLPGTALQSLLEPGQITVLRDLLARHPHMSRPLLAMSLSTDPPTDVIAHRSAGLLVLEFEPRHAPDPEDPLALVQSMIRHVQLAPTTEAFCDAITREIHAVTGFDRVMLYRFAPDDTGAVIAEVRHKRMQAFLGLHFPASDIPSQARALYRDNWIRMIPDARYAPASLLPTTAAALDLSQSTLRSVSPVHRQYLANMGVIAAMSLSLVVRGRLWGLIACHHASPRQVPYRVREACALFAEMVSSKLEMKLAAEGFADRLHSTQLHEALLTRMSQEPDLAAGLAAYGTLLLDFIPADGIGLWIDGRFTGLGTTPDATQIEALTAWLDTAAPDDVFHTDRLQALYPPAVDFAGNICGLLAIALSRQPRDHVLWFRSELVHTIDWAGNPDKLAEGEILTPRRSFAIWRQSVTLRAAPWRDVEIEAAHRLRLSLVEVVLSRVAQIAQANAAAREAGWQQQELLMRELDRGLEEWKTIARALRKETERRAQAEAELSQVLRRTVRDQEAERQRIARELHDTLGQSLTLLQLGLDGICTEPAVSAAVRARVAALKTLAAETGGDVNRLAWEIRPTALDDLGIQVAMRNFIEMWSERSGVAADLHLTLDGRELPPTVESTLYRVLQEALTNVVRHAEASHVGVILGVSADTVSMIVEDNGRGFGWDPAETTTPPGRRLGLLGIRERLSLVEGTLEVETAPGRGTTLFIRIPV